jgi:hypothetical protein
MQTLSRYLNLNTYFAPAQSYLNAIFPFAPGRCLCPENCPRIPPFHERWTNPFSEAAFEKKNQQLFGFLNWRMPGTHHTLLEFKGKAVRSKSQIRLFMHLTQSDTCIVCKTKVKPGQNEGCRIKGAQPKQNHGSFLKFGPKNRDGMVSCKFY